MAVAAMMQYTVQVHQGIGSNRRPEFLDELAVKTTNFFSGECHLPDKRNSSAEVNCGGDKRLFHGQCEMTIAMNASFVSQCLLQAASKANSDVLHRMVLIHVQVTAGFDGQIEQAVSGEECEHVIEEADAGGNLRLAGPIQRQLQGDLGFGGIAADGGSAIHEHFFGGAVTDGRNSGVSRGYPVSPILPEIGGW